MKACQKIFIMNHAPKKVKLLFADCLDLVFDQRVLHVSGEIYPEIQSSGILNP
jgi:hypothetical protein